MSADLRQRVAVAALTFSLGAFATWQVQEGFTSSPVIPTKGDVPTIGHGSTRYEDGTRVAMSDPPITRERAAELAWNLLSQDEIGFRATMPGAHLTQTEYDVYLDFVGQYGIGNWSTSSMRRLILEGEYRAACDALLLWRKQAGRDCSLPINWGPVGCKGVWTRQLERHEQCIQAVEDAERAEVEQPAAGDQPRRDGR